MSENRGVAPRAVSPHAGVYEWVDRDRLLSPPEGTVDVLRGRYWAVDATGRLCLYRWGFHNREISPQCNRDRAIAERIRPPGTVRIEKVAVAFVPHRCNR